MGPSNFWGGRKGGGGVRTPWPPLNPPMGGNLLEWATSTSKLHLSHTQSMTSDTLSLLQNAISILPYFESRRTQPMQSLLVRLAMAFSRTWVQFVDYLLVSRTFQENPYIEYLVASNRRERGGGPADSHSRGHSKINKGTESIGSSSQYILLPSGAVI